MIWSYFIIGTISLIFRIWLAEFKLKDELQFRRHYISRMLNLYFFLAMAFSFENILLNYISAAAMPVLLISFIGWDIPFFKKFKTRTYWQKNHAWLIVERLTLHVPMVSTMIYWYFTNLKGLFVGINVLLTLLIIFFICIVPYFLIDKRWKEKYLWPVGLSILSSASLALIGLGIYLTFF